MPDSYTLEDKPTVFKGTDMKKEKKKMKSSKSKESKSKENVKKSRSRQPVKARDFTDDASKEMVKSDYISTSIKPRQGRPKSVTIEVKPNAKEKKTRSKEEIENEERTIDRRLPSNKEAVSCGYYNLGDFMGQDAEKEIAPPPKVEIPSKEKARPKEMPKPSKSPRNNKGSDGGKVKAPSTPRSSDKGSDGGKVKAPSTQRSSDKGSDGGKVKAPSTQRSSDKGSDGGKVKAPSTNKGSAGDGKVKTPRAKVTKGSDRMTSGSSTLSISSDSRGAASSMEEKGNKKKTKKKKKKKKGCVIA